MAKGEVDEAMKELKAKLEEKAESKPAAQPDEDQRKLFVGGLAQVRRICFQFNAHKLNTVLSFRMPRIPTSRSILVTLKWVQITNDLILKASMARLSTLT